MFKVRRLKKDNVKDVRELAEFSVINKLIPLLENCEDRWCVLPKHLENMLKSILNFEVRMDDVFVVTFMKCGTTWMQEAVWLLLNNLNFQSVKQSSVMHRTIFLEFPGIHPGIKGTIERFDQVTSPRLIKSHLPTYLLPNQLWEKKSKTIYVARNVKDVVVSSYHFLKGIGCWFGTINEFVEEFISNEIIYTPFWSHIVDFWKLRNEPYIFFVTYEEMKRDLGSVLKTLCEFLGRPRLTDQELHMLIEHLNFENMRDNEEVNIKELLIREMPTKVDENFQFMRRGVVGSYKDELTIEQQNKLNAWSQEFLSKYEIKQEDIFGNN